MVTALTDLEPTPKSMNMMADVERELPRLLVDMRDAQQTLRENRMKRYLIFHYKVRGQDFIEAYPIQGDLPSWVLWAQFGHENTEATAFVSSISRNQARRAAYTNWIRADGQGFNQLPYRAYSEATP